MMRKSVTAGVSLCVAASGLLLVQPASASAPATLAQRATTPTPYAMQASGYSTRVIGRGIPVDSDRTAFQVIGCTNKAGLSKKNRQAGVDVGGIHVGVATTHVWTTKKNNTVSSWGRNHIASVTLGGATAGSVSIKGIDSLSRAWHNGRGYHASTRATIASITKTVLGVTVSVPLPTRGNPVNVLGITIALGKASRSHSASGASAILDAVRLDLPTNTTVLLAHSRAKIHGGVKSGLFRGSAYAAKAQAVAGVVKVGKTPFVVMPCQGTGGKVIRKDIARVSGLSGLAIKGLHADQVARQTMRKASGHERGRVARVRLGGSNNNRTLVVRGIVGRANLHYTKGHGVNFDTKGSQILSVRLLTARGSRLLHFGKDNKIDILGLATLKSHIVKKTKTSIQITELRISVLGTGPNAGAEIDLGSAKIGFRKSGL